MNDKQGSLNLEGWIKFKDLGWLINLTKMETTWNIIQLSIWIAKRRCDRGWTRTGRKTNSRFGYLCYQKLNESCMDQKYSWINKTEWFVIESDIRISQIAVFLFVPVQRNFQEKEIETSTNINNFTVTTLKYLKIKINLKKILSPKILKLLIYCGKHFVKNNFPIFLIIEGSYLRVVTVTTNRFFNQWVKCCHFLGVVQSSQKCLIFSIKYDQWERESKPKS